MSSICSCLPTKLTSFAMPKCLAKSSATGRSGPSPTIINFAGTSFFTAAKTFITSSTLFTFLKLLACNNIFSPLGAIVLFGAAHLTKKWQVFLIPLLATWLSDLFINNVIYAQYNPQFVWFYEGFYWQYGSYLLIGFVAIFIFNKVERNFVDTV